MVDGIILLCSTGQTHATVHDSTVLSGGPVIGCCLLHFQCDFHTVFTHYASSAVVETVNKKREPLNTLSGVYFISGTEKSVQLIIEDFKTQPLYKTAHIFFSSRVAPSLLQEIRGAPGLLSRLRSLKEVPLLPPFPFPNPKTEPCTFWVCRLSLQLESTVYLLFTNDDQASKVSMQYSGSEILHFESWSSYPCDGGCSPPNSPSKLS